MKQDIRKYRPNTGGEEARHAFAVQNETANAFRELMDETVAGGVFVSDVSFTAATDKEVLHKLGRKPRGWIVIDTDTSGQTFYRTAWDANKITLTAEYSGTASFWVF